MNMKKKVCVRREGEDAVGAFLVIVWRFLGGIIQRLKNACSYISKFWELYLLYFLFYRAYRYVNAI